MQKQHDNIIFSGWPSSGGSTLALISAYLLGYQYVYAGGIFKTFAKEIYGDDSGPALMEFENNMGEAWDHIWERYAAKIIVKKSDLIMEGKTAGFLYDTSRTFAIMVTASAEARAKRAQTDNRSDAVETIRRRDKEVRARLINVLDVDIYDKDAIQDHYDLMLDTSDMSISEVLLAGVDAMSNAGFDVALSDEEANELEETYWEHGKAYFKDKLNKQNQFLSVADVFADWQNMFPQQVADLPQPMQQVINKYVR